MKGSVTMIVDPYSNPLLIIDIGAAQPDYNRWASFPKRMVIGFEPNEEEFSKLSHSENIKFYNCAVGAINGKIPLFVTGYWSNTSTLRPNMSLIRQLAYREDDWAIQKTLDVECRTLDSVLDQESVIPDFIKVDTQGSELSILRASPKTLKTVFGVDVEVEFLSLYEHQPLFEDVQKFMYEQGFQLMDLGDRLHVKGRNSVGLGGNKSNFISANALYFRTLDSFTGGIERLNSAVAVCLAYGYADYALELCLKFEKLNSDLSEHAEAIQKFLLKSDLSFGKRFKRLPMLQYIGRKLRGLSNRIVIDDHPEKTAYWFGGIGNKN
jgi:FkbM family methyltransferase